MKLCSRATTLSCLSFYFFLMMLIPLVSLVANPHYQALAFPVHVSLSQYSTKTTTINYEAFCRHQLQHRPYITRSSNTALFSKEEVQNHDGGVGGIQFDNFQKNDNNNDTILVPPPPTTKARNKPHGYWLDAENVRHELREFWEHAGATPPDPQHPPIPPFNLLLHFRRYDIKQGIQANGGREALAELISTRMDQKTDDGNAENSDNMVNGVEVVNGRWKVAVVTSRVMKQLVANASSPFQRDYPPLSPQLLKQKPADYIQNRETYRWNYNRSQTRKQKYYWTTQQLVESLYDYLEQQQSDRPSVWMPRVAEISDVSLRQALSRFRHKQRKDQEQEDEPPSKIAQIDELAGLVPYAEWRYFQDQLDLLVLLRDFLDEHHGGNYTFMPSLTEIHQYPSYQRLPPLIARLGGRRFVAAKFGLRMPVSYRKDFPMYGRFDLEFGIELLRFIRNQQSVLRAPLTKRTIAMPTEYQLFQARRDDLTEQISVCGGYENVARRLGLDYFP